MKARHGRAFPDGARDHGMMAYPGSKRGSLWPAWRPGPLVSLFLHVERD